jgi:hypothetical protein
VGLILRALPGAAILSMRRDPLDLCLSCFTKLFQGDLPYAYDLAELGRRHGATSRLAAHWERLSPRDRFLSVDYEDLVSDLEGTVRRVLAFLDLPFDRACLAFHTLDRPVRTASLVQVRQPLFTTSLGRGRALGSRLDPLRLALGQSPAP